MPEAVTEEDKDALKEELAIKGPKKQAEEAEKE